MPYFAGIVFDNYLYVWWNINGQLLTPFLMLNAWFYRIIHHLTSSLPAVLLISAIDLVVCKMFR